MSNLSSTCSCIIPTPSSWEPETVKFDKLTRGQFGRINVAALNVLDDIVKLAKNGVTKRVPVTGITGTTYVIAEATTSILVLKNGTEDLTATFDPNTHTWTFGTPLISGDKLTFLYNKT